MESSRSIPVLRNFDHKKGPIGFVKMMPEGLQVTFKDGEELTKDQFFSVFGECSVKVEISVSDPKTPLTNEKIKMATISCFSLGWYL